MTFEYYNTASDQVNKRWTDLEALERYVPRRPAGPFVGVVARRKPMNISTAPNSSLM
jgi:hypothetical protein